MSDSKTTPLYALFRGDKQISKAHTTIWAVRTEAIQSNLVTQSGSRQFWPAGYDVKEIAHEHYTNDRPLDSITGFAT